MLHFGVSQQSTAALQKAAARINAAPPGHWSMREVVDDVLAEAQSSAVDSDRLPPPQRHPEFGRQVMAAPEGGLEPLQGKDTEPTGKQQEGARFRWQQKYPHTEV
eukprot:CAMPEP_0117694298 /NCGR_PEP_ID=MMETSP0804-20121206/27372_1 /TAXON_ID=1074897 /ORGANISM="Tetraselmis astigmatica, Strain CCMP880" /LENGTH=104 /DNA_ID=CAMNT_0005507975 /DNA_START=695 /DNA_END=1009 /DNA_ORIENTATION=-